MLAIVLLVIGQLMFIGAVVWEHWWVPRKRYEYGHSLFQLSLMGLTSKTGLPYNNTRKYTTVVEIVGLTMSFFAIEWLYVRAAEFSLTLMFAIAISVMVYGRYFFLICRDYLSRYRK